MNRNDGDPLDPWDRRKHETPRAYDAFLSYRNMGRFHRSLRQLARNGPATNLRQLAEWSRLNDWVDRAGSYDDWLDRESQIEQVEQVKAMRRRHAALGFQMYDIAAERIRSINIEKLTVRDTLMLVEIAVKLERQARGEVDTIEELRGEQEADGPTGADILHALRTSPALMNLADELDRQMLEGPAEQ